MPGTEAFEKGIVFECDAERVAGGGKVVIPERGGGDWRGGQALQKKDKPSKKNSSEHEAQSGTKSHTTLRLAGGAYHEKAEWHPGKGVVKRAPGPRWLTTHMGLEGSRSSPEEDAKGRGENSP